MPEPARDRLIDAAISLTQRKGVSGTTVADLLEDSGVARRSLYLNFAGGREELLATASATAAARLTAGMGAAVTGAARAVDAVTAIFSTTRDQLVASNFESGCPVLAAALGGADVPVSRRQAARAFDDWRALLSERLVSDGVAAERAEALATLVVASYEGAVVMSVASRSTKHLDHIEPLLQQVLAAG